MKIPSRGPCLRVFNLALLLATLLPGALLADARPAWLLVNLPSQESIVTTDTAERDKLTEVGWKVDGSGSLLTGGQQGAGALHRLWRATPQGADRVLETDIAQIPIWVKAGYVDEGSVGFVAAADGPGRVPVYQYRKGEKRIWLINDKTQAAAKNAGWKLQGVHFWLWPSITK
ncbi:MAG TPA: hypothetical protein DEQ40_06775 [Oxalobacteraceae bacterium]|nr:hypothetical protein [Oxalobacteraceae bacterium]